MKCEQVDEYFRDCSFNVILRYFSLLREEILEIHCLIRNRLMGENPLVVYLHDNVLLCDIKCYNSQLLA